MAAKDLTAIGLEILQTAPDARHRTALHHQ